MKILTDEEIIMKHDQSVRGRARMELAIVNQFLADCAAVEYSVCVPEYEDEGETEYDVRTALFDLDDAHAVLSTADGEPRGWVYFVFGNDGYDVISDYTTNLETFLAPCDQLSRWMEEHGGAPAQIDWSWLDDREFYEAMQSYRCAPLAPQSEVVARFEEVKRLIRAHAAKQAVQSCTYHHESRRCGRVS